MKLLSYNYLLILLYFWPFITAGDDQHQAKLALNQALQGITTMQAHFVQTIIDSDKQLLQRSEGNMILQRPGFFRWDIQKPNQQLVLINQQRIWIYDKDLAQVTTQALSQAIGATPALLLSNTNQSLTEGFSITQVSKSAQGQWFYLQPRVHQEQFTQIKFHFTQQGISEMELQDSLGQITRIKFENLKLNLPIHPSLFKFIPPKGVDIIHSE